MRFELLGSLQVQGPEGVSSLSAPKIELLLATLLVGGGHPSSKEQLIAELWDDRPPRRAAATLYVYISQLRKFLTAAGDEAGLIDTRPPGYRVRLEDGALDLHDFQRLAGQGRALFRAGRPQAALAAFEAALSLYRGPMLDGMSGRRTVAAISTWVDQERLECLELSIDAQIMLGRHREITKQLGSLTAQYPLREAFYRQRMLALYRSERRAEALKVYHTARAVLRADLNLEPSRALRDLHQAILVSDRALEATGPEAMVAEISARAA